MSTRYVLPDPYKFEGDFERDRRLFLGSLLEEQSFFILHKDNTSDTFILKKKQQLPVSWELRMERLNEEGNVFFIRFNTKNIINGVALYMDERKLWDGLLPSTIIKYSTTRICAIWFTEDTPFQGSIQLNEWAVKRFRDSKAYDLVFLPGFYYKGFMVKMVHYSGEIFTFRELTEYFSPHTY